MWLAVARRAAPAAPLTDQQLAFALRMVAHELDEPPLNRESYRRRRDALVDADRAAWGDESVLARVLPSLNQIDAQLRWEQALTIAGLPTPTEKRGERGPSAARRYNFQPERPGLPLAQATACYAALNRTWPSKPALRAFANHARFALPDFKHVKWSEVRAQLANCSPPTASRRPPAMGLRPWGAGND